jgi:2-dehydro-3-deoxygalactonokinase
LPHYEPARGSDGDAQRGGLGMTTVPPPVAPPSLLAVDWGTTSLRGALIDARGAVLAERSFARGILSVSAGGFADVFSSSFGDWVRDGVPLCLVSGMAGSKQGWVEAPYCACPAGFADLAGQLRWVDNGSLALPVAIVPGLCCASPAHRAELPPVPDVMRGEEVQIFGAMQLAQHDHGVFVLPGTHSKWVDVQGGRVQHFQTFMSGEFYALLSQHSLLARSITPDAPFDATAFSQGVGRAAEGAGLLHNAFGTRTLSLFGRLEAGPLASYLSGLVIGEELHARQLRPDSAVVLVGSSVLVQRYALALSLQGIRAQAFGAEATWAGLHALAQQIAPHDRP